ncbi:MAG: hypothetical protein JWQ50_7943, partial [Caballeronia mineralivorans]|nr:hypothetical protein [Caballeronia mineralivorans]MDB5788028.1 hypothetical protein [Caballeronia mineralivorans]
MMTRLRRTALAAASAALLCS